MKKLVLLFALTAGLITSATLQAQTVNMNSYITLTVTDGAAIKLDFKAAAASTPVRITSGNNTQDITVGTSWYDGNEPSDFTVTANGTEMKVYGNISGFNCSDNGENVSALDVSKNTQLTTLRCYTNKFSGIDLSQNTQLTELDCSNNNNLSNIDLSENTQLTELYLNSNNLSSLDVSKNTQLTMLDCSFNNLSNIDLSKNTQLTTLHCYSNKLNSLDVSRNTQLTELHCTANNLTALDVSKNTVLEALYCDNNKLSTSALDSIYCDLPDRRGKEAGVIQPIYNASSTNYTTVVATTKGNAIQKNWMVQYYEDDTDIPTTTGSYDCTSGSTDVVEATAESALTLYPNPVEDVLYLSAPVYTIHIYNMYGIEVAKASNTDRLAVAHLPAGIYTVKADGTLAKMVKR